MRIDCVVPATDAPATLERCLAAIREGERPPETLTCVTEPPGAGPAAARNAGAREGEGELIAFVDSDVVIHPDAFVRIEAAFESDPGLDAVFGAYDDRPEAPGAVSGFRNLLHHRVHLEGGGDAETFWAGIGAVRRDAFEAVGGFDPERFPRSSVEDIELGMRLVAGGRTVRLDPGIQGTHLKTWTLAQMVRVDVCRRGIPWTRLLLESGRTSTTLNLGPRHLTAVAASILAAVGLVARRPRVAALGTGILVASNAPLYGLIWRRRGPAEAIVAPGLHLIHHLSAAFAAAVGLFGHLTRPRDRR